MIAPILLVAVLSAPLETPAPKPVVFTPIYVLPPAHEIPAWDFPNWEHEAKHEVESPSMPKPADPVDTACLSVRRSH